MIKLSQILIYTITSFFISLVLYPSYIYMLKRIKAGKKIRDKAIIGDAKIFKSLHGHKEGTPTMGGGLFILVMIIMVLFSIFLKYRGIINNSLISRSETYILLFGFFSMGIIGLIDDFLNIKNINTIKGLSAKAKLIGMFLFSGFIAYWFYYKLGIDYINLRPIAGNIKLGIFYPIFLFIFTVFLVNAINITDGLDGLAGGLSVVIFAVLGVITFIKGRYLSTTVLGIFIATLLAFLWFNIYPARVFMGDSGAFAIGGLMAVLVYILNINFGIFIPFTILFFIFITEITSSALQIFWKKVFHKKLFKIAPIHHLFEYKGYPETNIVMRAWLIQGILGMLTLILVIYQITGTLFH